MTVTFLLELQYGFAERAAIVIRVGFSVGVVLEPAKGVDGVGFLAPFCTVT